LEIPELIIPEDIPLDRFPSLLRNWYLGSKARRHLSTRRFIAVAGLASRGASRGRALDVGCGWGYDLFLLQRAGFDPCGIDIVQDDFLANRKIAEANGYDSKLACADVGDLPFASGTFSAVTAVETFEHIYAPDREKAVREIARVLVPGGVFVLSTPNYHSIVETGKRFLVKFPFLKRFFPAMCYPAGDIEREDYHPYSYHRPASAAELEALLNANGFTITDMRTIIFVFKNAPDLIFPVLRLSESVLEGIPILRGLASTLVLSARKIPPEVYKKVMPRA
jgi:2-polyprenyl-3-methyl-5-hydroxy-6-metoxy-1,4-benzoquinol methylase